ncbi:MAG: cyclopropane fatty acyl phospholipid synthase [Candidatus Thioglobus sp.]|jgi:cyclopropane-fatty-acyl-phospholipid synthase|nr:cyclopropane fatty acyl phospholipid synthase [Candidatus Thioglobus sp.]
MSKFKTTVTELLESADIRINGQRPYDIQVHNDDFYARVLSGGTLAFGESYMDGWWDCDALDQLAVRLLSAHLDKKVKATNPSVLLTFLSAYLFNTQSKGRAYIVGEKHYDMGNNLFSLMLDKRMNYSCAYWRHAKDLDQAQVDKMDLICRKMHLKPGMKVLEIGCGWGGFAKYTAENYEVNVYGITISKEQEQYAKESCKGLDVSFELKDYRELNTQYDRIISIGMFEHVGYKNYKTYMKVAHRCLKDDGLFLLHTIGRNSSVQATDSWINKYIFPNGMTPSANQISAAIEDLFVIEDWHSFGQDYDKTLMAWHENFQNNLSKLKDSYDERFQRMWQYYLLMCAGSFRARRNQLWQLVLTKNGIRGGYEYQNNSRFNQLI